MKAARPMSRKVAAPPVLPVVAQPQRSVLPSVPPVLPVLSPPVPPLPPTGPPPVPPPVPEPEPMPVEPDAGGSRTGTAVMYAASLRFAQSRQVADGTSSSGLPVVASTIRYASSLLAPVANGFLTYWTPE